MVEGQGDQTGRTGVDRDVVRLDLLAGHEEDIAGSKVIVRTTVDTGSKRSVGDPVDLITNLDALTGEMIEIGLKIAIGESAIAIVQIDRQLATGEGRVFSCEAKGD